MVGAVEAERGLSAAARHAKRHDAGKPSTAGKLSTAGNKGLVPQAAVGAHLPLDTRLSAVPTDVAISQIILQDNAHVSYTRQSLTGCRFILACRQSLA